MKVKKVDIKVQELNIGGNPYYLRVPVIEKLSCQAFYDEDPVNMERCDIQTLEYPILKMYHPQKGEFYMAVQDKDLFETLLEFKKGRLESIEQRANINGFNEGYAKGLNNASKEIKKLSWFKRLFNKF